MVNVYRTLKLEFLFAIEKGYLHLFGQEIAGNRVYSGIFE